VTPQTPEGQMLSAELRGDKSAWRRLRKAGAPGEWWEVAPVAFVLAARRRFTADVDRRTATRFAVRFVAQAAVLNASRFDSAGNVLGNGKHHGAVFTDFVPVLDLNAAREVTTKRRPG